MSFKSFKLDVDIFSSYGSKPTCHICHIIMLNMLIFAHWRGGQIAKTWCFNLRVIPATRPEAQLFIEKNPMHQSHGGTYTGDFVKGKRHLAAKCDGPVKDEADISTTYLNDSQCMSYSFLVIGNPRLQPWSSLCQ